MCRVRLNKSNWSVNCRYKASLSSAGFLSSVGYSIEREEQEFMAFLGICVGEYVVAR